MTIVPTKFQRPIYPPTLKINKNNNVLFLFMLPFDLRVCWSEQAVTWPHDSDHILSSFYITSPSRSTHAMIPSGYYHTLALPFVPIWSHGPRQPVPLGACVMKARGDALLCNFAFLIFHSSFLLFRMGKIGFGMFIMIQLKMLLNK